MKLNASKLALSMGTNPSQICRWTKAGVLSGPKYGDTDALIVHTLLFLRRRGHAVVGPLQRRVADAIRYDYRSDSQNWLIIVDNEATVANGDSALEDYLAVVKPQVALVLDMNRCGVSSPLDLPLR